MRYGRFDSEAREYVIERPDTPEPWVNYLGSPEYGAIISNHAGGYSFEKSGANGRILRYVFNHMDQPGRYLYIRDSADGDFWTTSWMPVGKPLEEYRTECRHGLGYTIFSSEYRQIRSETCYYVPLGQTYEVWELQVENKSGGPRDLTVTAYAEFTNDCNYEQDQINLQYSQFISRTRFSGSRISQVLHGNLEALPGDEEVDDKRTTERFLGVAGADVASWCGDRASFLGNCRGYGNPAGVEAGFLGNVDGYNENTCGALSVRLELAPGERRTICFVLGQKYGAEADRILARYRLAEEACRAEREELKAWWEERLSAFQIRSPEPAFDEMINTWNAYNCYMTFIWSRAASFIYCGLRNGYGYRDTVQDIQGILHLDPPMAKERIRFMLSAQAENGGGLPLVKFTHNAGHEDTPEQESYVRETGHPSYRADDALWLFPTVYKYLAETGDLAFLEERIPFADRGEGTVYEHLERALDFSRNHPGGHGLPAGLYADWNDCLRLGAKGESVFVACQFVLALSRMQEMALALGRGQEAEKLREEQAAFSARLQELCWDGDRFIRGFTEDGARIGAAGDAEASLWLNPQSWAVISGLADEDQAEKAMDLVAERLNTAYGAVLMDPPYQRHAFPGALAVIYNQGTKENAGIFSQPQGWLILAEALRGRGGRAWEYYRENCPALQNEEAEIRHMEPYCFGQFTEGPASPHFGRSHVHWLTGTASTVMVGSVEGILGIRPDLYGLRLAPSVPADWKDLEIRKRFRGRNCHIVVQNPDGRESGCRQLVLNGETIEGNYIPAERLQEENEILLVI